MIRSKEAKAPNTTPTTTPANNKRSVCCTPHDKTKDKATANHAPMKAMPVMPMRMNQGDILSWLSNTMPMATPKLAPDALPNKYGSANGFRNKPCANAPANPSKAPAKQAPRVLGKRMSAIKLKSACSCIPAKPSLPTNAPKPTSSNSKQHSCSAKRPAD